MVSIILFLLATAHLVLELYTVYTASNPAKVTQASPIIALLLVSILTLIACCLCYKRFQSLIGDLILIWRVYMVWARRWWIIVVPLCATIAGTSMYLLYFCYLWYFLIHLNTVQSL
jgi:hypothetical protein